MELPSSIIELSATKKLTVTNSYMYIFDWNTVLIEFLVYSEPY